MKNKCEIGARKMKVDREIRSIFGTIPVRGFPIFHRFLDCDFYDDLCIPLRVKTLPK